MVLLGYTEVLKEIIDMKRLIYFLLLFFIFIIGSCNTTTTNEMNNDTPQSGTIYISVDESFKPVIEQQIKVFQVSYPKAKIVAEYKAEVDCFRDLQEDSTRMIIVARGINEQENHFFKTKLSYTPKQDILAFDAVAVVVNRNAKDSVFTLNQLKEILSGKTNIPVIMDGNNATSTVRFLKDSILKGEPFGKNVVASNGSNAVIEAIAKMPNAIGFVGLSWVGNNDDPKQKEQLNKIKLSLIECVKCEEKGVFAKPSQSTITYGQYPLARPLYYVLKEYSEGLGTGFKNFMTNERGQLIFRRAYLAPAKMNLTIRSSAIKEEQ
jgi:phosphate transport system substrate-binding protein